MTRIDPLPRLELPGAHDTADGGATLLKRLIWVYFWLLIFEGAVRKWILPGLANPLLIIRDPVVILIYVVALVQGRFPRNGFISALFGLGLVSAAVSEFAGRGNFLITVFGLRTNFLHLPLIFLIPRVFTIRDVEEVGKWLMIVAFPMALLVAAQFRASPDSLLNVGVGGSMGGQLEVGFGKIRPPGTFSFNTGLVAYVAFLAAAILSTLMRERAPHRKLAHAALPALALMVGVSGSRSSLGAVAIILVGLAFICATRREFLNRGIRGFLVIGLAYFALCSWSEFRTGLMVHEHRLETGGGFKHGLFLRVVGGFTAPFYAIANTPIFGEGLGMGTNVAAGLLTGERNFLLAEGEWERAVRESGPILGFAFLALRLAILVHLFRRALAALRLLEPWPMLIFSAAAPGILNGQFGVPTTLGFAVFSAGCCLAAAEAASVRVATIPLTKPVVSTGKIRGRSIYAEQLHGG